MVITLLSFYFTLLMWYVSLWNPWKSGFIGVWTENFFGQNDVELFPKWLYGSSTTLVNFSWSSTLYVCGWVWMDHWCLVDSVEVCIWFASYMLFSLLALGMFWGFAACTDCAVRKHEMVVWSRFSSDGVHLCMSCFSTFAVAI